MPLGGDSVRTDGEAEAVAVGALVLRERMRGGQLLLKQKNLVGLGLEQRLGERGRALGPREIAAQRFNVALVGCAGLGRSGVCTAAAATTVLATKYKSGR